jgi:hypothetical protein
MTARSPLHDPTDAQLVFRLIANMKLRDEGALAPATLATDRQLLEEEITFSEQRLHILKERCSLASTAGAFGADGQIFNELLNETERELNRLYNARQFLTAEKLISEGMPREEVVALLENS